MSVRDLNPVRIISILGIVAGVCSCQPATEVDSGQESAGQESQLAQPIYRSGKRVSSDCGVEFMARPPPGFAEAPGAETQEMSKPATAFMAIGAEREQVETDPERVSPGYVLIEPTSVRESFLVSNEKEVVATFRGDYIGGFSQLLPNGNRLVSSNVRTEVFEHGGGGRGCIEEYLPDGKLLWRMNLHTENYIHHHDVVKLPNGNVLAAVWERVAAAEAISQGRDPENVAESGDFWYDGVIEVNPYTLEIVWEWSARHHMVQEFDPGKANFGTVADHPELLNINLVHRSPGSGKISADWTHVNALDYNPALDQIVLSSNYVSEIWVIDHSTTPHESAGHEGGLYGKGGDFLYRWGNPQNYNRGTEESQKLFSQHDVQWIKPGLNGEGHILVFNNGSGKLRPYSTVVEFAPTLNADGSYTLGEDMTYGPEALAWEYNPEPPERFFSFFISGAQRMPNGNTLINQGAGAKVREVTPSGEIIWEYGYTDDIDAPHMLFRANRYPADHPGLAGLLN